MSESQLKEFTVRQDEEELGVVTWRRDDSGESIQQLLFFLLTCFRCKIGLLSKSDPFDFDLFCKDFKGLLLDPSHIPLTLSWIGQEGLLDSIVPHLRASLVKIQKSTTRFLLPANHHQLNQPSRPTEIHQPPPPHKFKKTKEIPEIGIHVCEEGRGLWQDFKCPQNVLLRGMGYFARLGLKGQNIQDMDISVHCEIKIFEWLLQWISSSNHKEMIGEINALNVVGLVVSAEFLQIPSLTRICCDFIRERIESLLSAAPNLGCLTESLIGRLTLDPVQIETRIVPLDGSDRITSRLYTHSILRMFSSGPLETLFKCSRCKSLLTNDNAFNFPCLQIKINQFGKQFGDHRKDPAWSPQTFLKELKRKLKTWRRVYWRLWGIANNFICLNCGFYYPATFSRSSSKLNPETLDDLQHPVKCRRSDFEFKTVKNVDQSPSADPIFQPINYYGHEVEPCHHVPDLSVKNALEKLELVESYPDLIEQGMETPPLDEDLKKLKPRNAELSRVAQALMAKGAVDWSSGPQRELDVLLTQYGFGGSLLTKDSPRPGVGDVWAWNPDLSTRYNQDMQREMEEKLMNQLATSLSQRIPF